jgi:hypothetical protein
MKPESGRWATVTALLDPEHPSAALDSLGPYPITSASLPEMSRLPRRLR